MPIITCALHGNPGNVMFVYLAALKLQSVLGRGRIAGINIPMWNIMMPDLETTGLATINLTKDLERKTKGEIFFHSIRDYMMAHEVEHIKIHAYCQNTRNLPDLNNFNFDEIFSAPNNDAVGYDESHLLISIRGNEILDAIHPDYTLIPIEFYRQLVLSTKLKPVLFGQLNDTAYLRELKRCLPGVIVHPGRNPLYDFETIRRSKNIVVSVSTFSWLAAWLSNADRIFLPLSGLFHPNQHRQTLFIPYGDSRYEYYLFPINRSVPVASYRQAHDPIRGRWRKCTEAMLYEMFERGPRNRIRFDRYLAAFDPESYVTMYADQKSNRDAHGDNAVFDHFATHGFSAGLAPLEIDRQWYCQMYPEAAVEIGQNDFMDELHHYVEIGRERGYLPRPPVRSS